MNGLDAGGLALREAFALAPGGTTITFAPALSGQTITLAAFTYLDPFGYSSLAANFPGGVTLDATSLAGGLTISDGTATNFRLFLVQSTSSLTLLGLTLQDGGGADFYSGGGAISNFGTLTLTHCTLSGNTANDGGGIFNSTAGTIWLRNTLVAGNTAIGTPGYGPDIFNAFGIFSPQGMSIVQGLRNSGAVINPGSLITLAVPLAPLAHYGGPTQTMALLPGSPAHNAAVGSSTITDQRGFPIIGTPDIGAYEAGSLAPNYNAYIYETLPAIATTAQRAATFDFDGDRQTNHTEWLALTDAASAASFLRITGLVHSGGSLQITFPSATGRAYRLERSDVLTSGSWSDTGLPAITGDGTVKTFTVPAGTPARRFFRVAIP